jgi:3-deoxy-D-manno-octulosonate 8-phosphate phosphatase (KDO 8-P phosphatase)
MFLSEKIKCVQDILYNQYMFKEIKLIVLDVDGTLTDAMYTVSEKGVRSKSFNTRDFFGIAKAIKKGMKIAVITWSRDQCIVKKVDGLPQWMRDNIFVRIHEEHKIVPVTSILEQNQMTWENVAVIGDDENDIPIMDMATFVACPNDAMPKVKDKVNYISDYNGGRGAVRDVIEYIFERQEAEEGENK